MPPGCGLGLVLLPVRDVTVVQPSGVTASLASPRWLGGLAVTASTDGEPCELMRSMVDPGLGGGGRSRLDSSYTTRVGSGRWALASRARSSSLMIFST